MIQTVRITQLIILSIAFVDLVQGHGMMLKPAGRSSRWRVHKTAPVNRNDFYNNCGGLNNQWGVHGGKCGLCGDNYGDRRPRANELGGKYGGSGVIVRIYRNTPIINVGVELMINHKGYMYFELCNLDQSHAESEDCFRKYRLKFANGQDNFFVGNRRGMIDLSLILPAGLSCKHCVLRWTYVGGNLQGVCRNGKKAFGCGPQETFKSCADVSIFSPPRG